MAIDPKESMPDLVTQSRLIMEAKIELAEVVLKQHNAGLNYWEILKLLLSLTNQVAMQSEAEYALKGGCEELCLPQKRWRRFSRSATKG